MSRCEVHILFLAVAVCYDRTTGLTPPVRRHEQPPHRAMLELRRIAHRSTDGPGHRSAQCRPDSQPVHACRAGLSTQQRRSNQPARPHTRQHRTVLLLWCYGLLRGVSWWPLGRGSLHGMQEVRGSTLNEGLGESRCEVHVLVPVVFLMLPVVVLFALYPGLFTLSRLAR
jgi:hypothetical protein